MVFIGPEGTKKWYERKIDTLETILVVGKVRSESDLLLTLRTIITGYLLQPCIKSWGHNSKSHYPSRE